MPKISILIVEDESLIALGLAMAVEDLGSDVVGPVATVADALALLAVGGIDAAVIDANLLDGLVTPVAMLLTEQGVPFVVHSATGLPGELASALAQAPLVMKPARPEHVVGKLIHSLRHGN
ncbi:response regulator [Sphingomonas glacialis]|uniref:response regulator n=1 Tax=Sphingomonas glacialis TaxID=658225 RepID=UPI001F4FEC02|nr:response regulator [Sphingomonas glacialis]